MKAMSRCEHIPESDTVWIHLAKISDMDEPEIGSGGYDEI